MGTVRIRHEQGAAGCRLARLIVRRGESAARSGAPLSDGGSHAWHRYLRFWRPDARADITAELQFHIEAAVSEYVDAGMTAVAARAKALERFGSVATVTETLHHLTRQRERSMRWTEKASAFRDDLRLACRALRTNSSFAFIAIFTLALGIGVNSAMFSVVDAVLFRPLPYTEAGKLVMLSEGLPSLGATNFGTITTADYVDYSTLSPSVFSSTAAFQGTAATLLRSGAAERVNGIEASASLLRVLGVRPSLGRDFTVGADAAGSPDAALLSDGFWRRDFGADPSIVGKSILLDGRATTVIGVLPRDVVFPLPGLRVPAADYIVPLRITSDVLRDRGNGYLTYMIARLGPGVSFARAQAAVATGAARLSAAYPNSFGRDNPVVAQIDLLRDRLTSGVRRSLLVLLGAVTLVLLVACLNVSGLLLARAAAREREIAVRGALGATRGRLIQQFVAESLVLVACGSAAGLVGAHWGARLLAASAPRASLSGYAVSVDPRVLGATLLVATIAVVAFSLVPVMYARDGRLAVRLRGEARGSSAGRRRQRGRRTLVTTEFAVAILLAAGAGLLVRSFANVMNQNPGFEPDHLLTFHVTVPRYRYGGGHAVIDAERRLRGRFAAMPGISHASAAIGLPTSSSWQTAITPEGVALERTPLVNNDAVLPGYFETLGIRIVQGRSFTERDDSTSAPVAVVDEEFARRYYPGASPIGRRIKWGSADGSMPWVTIVGVAARVKARSMEDAGAPAAYFPVSQLTFSASFVDAQLRTLTYVLRTRDEPAAVVADARRALASFDPQLAMVRPTTGDEMVSDSESSRRFNTVLLSGFAALACVLAAVGVYGLIAFTVEERRREMGIRLAVGATPARVIRLIVADGMRMALAGAVAGIAGAALAMPLMRSLLFGVRAFDPWTLAAVVLLLLLVAIFASWVPARRAARVDTVSALRG